MLNYKRAQSTLEYAIIIGVVVAALIAMQVYMKRGMQGRLRSATDEIGEQYSPGYTTGNYITITNTTSTETVSEGKTSTVSTTIQNRTGNETVQGFNNEYWPQ